MLDTRKLRLLHELRIRGTVSGVAKALSYSPSSVSQQLAALEREVGTVLLVKSGRRLRFTPQGELLAERTTGILDALDAAESAVATSGTTVSGVVRIAVFQSAAHAILPTALDSLARDFPELRVEIAEREPDQGLFEVSARDVDLAIAEQYPGSARGMRSDLDRAELATDSIHLATAKRRDARIRTTSLTAAAGLPWVLEPEGTAARTWAVQLCRTAGFEPDVRFETADLVAHIRLIASGNAVELLPGLVWSGDEPSICLLPLPGSPRRTIFTSARRSVAASPGVVACRRALAAAIP
ncbi:LysR family transcriptional regulator [Leifsonia xyli subsp. xyli]|uniref:Transcriptional regulator, LysR family n=2 Tax=Leifsonia xyli subsp. xyli TaxID=59736 RepID=Q6AH49_LEIXX|nr:LysR family transcriptional regulator [Leifsonia xyli]AAT88296.1 transcriptional regulator, LysR family [Leifsonia xyli subsp. xyli str. CTCB07]ODA89736.1 LysR family transcriptional regulator [Leifsonia xyli subsp. xyli]